MASPLDAYDPVFEEAGKEWNVDPMLLKAIAGQESGGNPKAVSKAGAQGLMQIIPETQKQLGVSRPFDPVESIWGGAKYLSQALDKEGTPERALAYYHGGPNWAAPGMYGPESAGYVPAVTQRYVAMAKAPQRGQTPTAPAGGDTKPGAAGEDVDAFLARTGGPVKPGGSGGPQQAESIDDFLKRTGGAAEPAETAEAQPSPAADAPQMMKPAGWSGIPGEVGGAAARVWNLLTPPLPDRNKPAGFEFPSLAPNLPSDTPGTPGPSGVDPRLALTIDVSKASAPGLSRIGQAAREGWGDSNPLMSPDLQGMIESGGPVGHYITSPVLQAGGAVLRGSGALFRGAQQALVEAGGGEAGPGRDIAAALEVAPMAGRGLIGEPPAPAAAPGPNALVASVQRGTDRIEAPLAPAFIDNALSPNYRGPRASEPQAPAPAPSPAMGATAAGTPASGEVVNGWRRMAPGEAMAPGQEVATDAHGQQWVRAEAAQPQAAGAEATSEPIPSKTKAEAARDLETSLHQTAEDRAGPQMEDHTVYVPGVERTLAARTFNAQNALDEKVAIAKDPDFRDQVDRVQRSNNQIMVDLLRKDAGDDISLDQAHTDREAVSPGGLQVFENQQPVDAQPFVNEIDSILEGEAGKRDAVKRTLKSVRDSLYDADGNLETMPSQLYGARQNITDLLKKGVKGVGQEADDVRASKAILTDLLDKIDPIISQGAPKFRDEYLPKFTEASQPINQQEFLQRYQTGARKLTGQDGYLQLSKVQKMLDDIYQGQKAKGVNLAKSLTDEQINNIIAVRNELAANSLRDRLGSVRGSDTFQQLNRDLGAPDTPLKAGVKGGANLLAHGAIAASPAAGVGNALLGGYQMVVKPAVKAAQEQKIRAKIAARKAELLQTNKGMTETP